MIFNIQKCSIHDGEGLRTLVFFKGCPLKCKWCANPESQNYDEEIMESPVRCVGCGACRDACPKGAILEDGSIDRTLCDNCMKCIDVCYAEAKKITGRAYTTEELYKEIEKDRPFYSRFGGGVTFSGGEPLTHGQQLRDIAEMCHEKGIHVVVESCGYGDFEKFKMALPYIDAMFMDIKHIDTAVHKELTGAGNALILNNIKKISEYGIPLTIRTPIVPGMTDREENIAGIAKFVAELPTAKEYELLAYHSFGESKYKALGRKYLLEGTETPSDEKMRELVKAGNRILSEYGKQCCWTKNNNKEVVK
ncbi:MAG: glycyl-radical enzyme activating protein [Emergencia timonensis]|uniref:glycyl-radical enzyme activating protein n=1 Tax=Emergencia timonensis TaxID=1776384 RepID=UPI000AED9D60|nr:glycyl-radical enzyme activating protein [Emergencia timonensis]WNX88873.1 glycyl-radical enzyme activating protein [Emergencia timonensis]